VGSIPSSPCHQFFNLGLQKNHQAPSVRVKVICSDHRLLWRDSYKDVDRALTPDESILHKIIIIFSFTLQVDILPYYDDFFLLLSFPKSLRNSLNNFLISFSTCETFLLHLARDEMSLL